MENTNGITPEEQEQANTRRAFNNAIERGVFVTDEAVASWIVASFPDEGMTDYVDEWMWMGPADDGSYDEFKNKITRKYIRVRI